MALHPNHPLLTDEINDGFRAPDLGWVGSQEDTSTLSPTQFHESGFLFSHFWVGSTTDIETFAQDFIQQAQDWLKSVVPNERSESPTLSVGVWNDPNTHFSLMMIQSFTDDFVIGESGRSFDDTPFPCLLKRNKDLSFVAHGDDENEPVSVARNARRLCPRAEQDQTFSVMINAAPAFKEDILTVFNRES